MLTNPLFAPLVGACAAILGATLAVFGNHWATRAREKAQFRRDKRLELYIDLQDEEYEVRQWLSRIGREPVKPAWFTVNKRWSSLMLRLDLFASPDVRTTARTFYHESKTFLSASERATARATRQQSGGVSSEEADRLREAAQQPLITFGKLWNLMRKDLGVRGISAETRDNDIR